MLNWKHEHDEASRLGFSRERNQVLQKGDSDTRQADIREELEKLTRAAKRIINKARTTENLKNHYKRH